MKIPQTPPDLDSFLQELGSERLGTLLSLLRAHIPDDYLHWDDLRRRPPLDDLSHMEWWWLLKVGRSTSLRELPLKDTSGKPFCYSLPDRVLELVHLIDRDASGKIAFREQVTDPHTRDRYIVSSLMEESITSSQLEGAATTRKVAKQMLRSGRAPRSPDERMILNNYAGMQHILSIQREPLTPARVLELHGILTAGTLRDPGTEGRLRSADDVVVAAIDGDILHTPPMAEELPERLEQMCAFANGETPTQFVPPVLRAILLHFWLAYDHPFKDGNGRTARGLFYWSMLHHGYWLCEFISISRLLKQAPARYSRAFLHTETDSNDSTYFVLHQLRVVDRAIRELEKYLEVKIQELRRTESLLKGIPGLNHRQLALLGHALKHPEAEYTFQSHRASHNVVYQTARTDIVDLVEKGLLVRRRRGQAYYFFPAPNLVTRLEDMC